MSVMLASFGLGREECLPQNTAWLPHLVIHDAVWKAIMLVCEILAGHLSDIFRYLFACSLSLMFSSARLKYLPGMCGGRQSKHSDGNAAYSKLLALQYNWDSTAVSYSTFHGHVLWFQMILL